MIDADLVLEAASQVVTMRDVGRESVRRAVAASVLEDACVATDGERIVFVGPAAECRQRVRLRAEGRTIDCSGRTILPGLIDPHTHLPFAGDRSGEFRRRLAGATYEEIAAAGGGILSTVKATRATPDEDLLRGCLERMDRLLRFGVTTAEAKSGYGLRRADEIRLLEIVGRASAAHPLDLVGTLLAAHVVPPEFQGRRRAYVDEVIHTIIPEIGARSLARFCDVFVEAGAFTVDEARAILTAGRRHGLEPRLHADQLSPGGGAELAAEMGAASADHLEHASPAGIEAMAGAGVVAVLLPAAGFFVRKTGFPAARALLDAGVAVALATDLNPGSCMTENLPLCATIACLTTGMDTDEALAAITVQAARSLRMDVEIGTLEVGKIADLAVFDVHDRTAILYHFGVNHCRTVIKRGRVVAGETVRSG